MAVMLEGSLTIAFTGVCTGSWDWKCQSVSVMGSFWKKYKWSASKAVIKPEIKQIHLILEASSSSGGLLLVLSHLFLSSFLLPCYVFSARVSAGPGASPKCHEKEIVIVSEVHVLAACKPFYGMRGRWWDSALTVVTPFSWKISRGEHESWRQEQLTVRSKCEFMSKT